jgi:AmiR/NasT family two-component response regulator
VLSAIQQPETVASWPPEAAAAVRRLVTEVRELREQTQQLQHALQSRIVIEQAKGILAERLGTTPADAFNLLRGAARSTHVRLHDLAAEVVVSNATPAAVAREVARSRREGAECPKR